MSFHTEILAADDFSINKAAEYLKNGEIVGMPTETVYGLAANALNPVAIQKIFAAKGRPQDNPLIVHISRFEQIEKLVGKIPKAAKKLADAFWPGPLTMVLPKSSIIPEETSGGLDTVGIRMPSHPVARRLIDACGFPLAAPSANLSGQPSPTTAAHVFHDMDGKIPLILDGGPCEVGVESTVVLVLSNSIRVLRPGGVTPEMLEQILPRVDIDEGVLHKIANDVKVSSPGMKYRHYSPKAEVIMIDSDFPAFIHYLKPYQKENGVYALVFAGEEQKLSIPSLVYGRKDDGLSQAQGLFPVCAGLTSSVQKKVFARCPIKTGVGLAVYNRMIRAAGFRVISL